MIISPPSLLVDVTNTKTTNESETFAVGSDTLALLLIRS